jgi:hypothetical protein
VNAVAFGPFLLETAPDYWQLRYDDANTCDMDLTPHGIGQSMVQGLTVHRPCADLRLWDALASILTLGNTVLFFPGDRPPLAARRSVTEHLPSDMVEALDQPVVVTSGSETLHELHRA